MSTQRLLSIRRVGQLTLGLSRFGIGLALLVRARLGLDAWDVPRQGMARRAGVSLGTVVIVSVVVLVLWITLRQRPGVNRERDVSDRAPDVASPPAPLKNALDRLYTEWHHKPVGFVSYGMTSAGLPAVEMAKPVLTALEMVPFDEAVSVGLRSRLDADGVLHPDAVMRASAQRLLTELRLLADALAPLRAGDATDDLTTVAS